MTLVWTSSFAMKGPFENPKKYSLNPKLRFYQLVSADVKNYKKFNPENMKQIGGAVRESSQLNLGENGLDLARNF